MILKEKPLSFTGSIFAPCLFCRKIQYLFIGWILNDLHVSFALFSLSLSLSLSLYLYSSLYFAMVVSPERLSCIVNHSTTRPNKLRERANRTITDTERKMNLNRFNESIIVRSMYKSIYLRISLPLPVPYEIGQHGRSDAHTR